MSISFKCPYCHTYHSLNKKKCRKCGSDLVSAKRSAKAKFYIKYRLPGKRKQFYKTASTLEEAKAIEADILLKKRAGNIADLKNRKMTFSDLSEWYLKLKSVQALAHYGVKKIHLDKFNAVFGDKEVKALIPSDLENYQHDRTTAGESDSYIDQQIGAVRTMLNKAYDNEIVSQDALKPFRKIKKKMKRNANARDRVLSSGEFDRLYSAASPHLKPILCMAYHTGMRQGEILPLTWDKVDMKGRVINLYPEDTKDREARKIPINNVLYDELSRIIRAIHIPNVFLYKGGTLKDIRGSIKAACKRAGIKYGRKVKGGFIFHDLRHTFVTNARKKGVQESVIMSITGHSTREMFDRYNTVDMEDIQEAVRKIEGL